MVSITSQFDVNVNLEFELCPSGMMQFPVSACFIRFDSVKMN